MTRKQFIEEVRLYSRDLLNRSNDLGIDLAMFREEVRSTAKAIRSSSNASFDDSDVEGIATMLDQLDESLQDLRKIYKDFRRFVRISGDVKEEL